MAPLDHLDTQILTLLQQDASLPVRTLAERVHSSPATVQRRVAQLRESGSCSSRWPWWTGARWDGR